MQMKNKTRFIICPYEGGWNVLCPFRESCQVQTHDLVLAYLSGNKILLEGVQFSNQNETHHFCSTQWAQVSWEWVWRSGRPLDFFFHQAYPLALINFRRLALRVLEFQLKRILQLFEEVTLCHNWCNKIVIRRGSNLLIGLFRAGFRLFILLVF